MVSQIQDIERQEAVTKFSLYFVVCLHPEISKVPNVSPYLQLHNIAFFIMPVSIVIVLFCFVLSRGMHLRKKIPFAKIPYISERRNGEILSSWCQVMQVQMEQTSFTQCPEHGSLFLGRFAGKMMMIHVKNKAQLLEQQEPTEAGLIK